MKRIAAVILCSCLHWCITANVSLPNIFSHNMVLQQNSTVRFWGWAKPGETIKLTASWTIDTLRATADSNSDWALTLKTPGAGGPYMVRVAGNNLITFENVLIGEVWLCSGQSNMEWSATSGITNAESAVAAANFPNIRLLTVGHRSADQQQIDLSSSGWLECTPETMTDFSAVAYFFAKKLYEATGIPIGLINASWGGTPAEAWTPDYVYQENRELAVSAAKLKPVPWGPVAPASIYNAMIAPLVNYRIAGTLWYQGESNTVNAETYNETLTALIKSWRSEWGYQFPFYFVQIAPFTYGSNENGVRVRDAQRRTLKLANTGMAVISDIGDTTDIHPQNKLDVGIRLAKLALKYHYKALDETVESPLFKGFKVENDRVIVSFDHAKGLHSTSKRPKYFELAGEDGVYHQATATIKDEQVLLKSKVVKKPVSVRFAWSNTAIPDLFNEAHLPASSFSSEY